MSKIYQVVSVNGTAKSSWEEILCDTISVNEKGLVFFFDNNGYLLIAYKLADGEAVIYVGEE